MAREIWTNPQLLDNIEHIKESEEDRYSDIPGWEGEYLASTPDAILLFMPNGKGKNEREIWFPIKHLRKAEDGQSIYASNWILTQKGF